jgi:hypothetical protein
MHYCHATMFGNLQMNHTILGMGTHTTSKEPKWINAIKHDGYSKKIWFPTSHCQVKRNKWQVYFHDQSKCIHNFITNFIEQSPSWEATGHSATQEIPRLLLCLHTSPSLFLPWVKIEYTNYLFSFARYSKQIKTCTTFIPSSKLLTPSFIILYKHKKNPCQCGQVHGTSFLT